MEVAVLDRNGKDTGRKAKLAKEVFGIEPNTHAIYLDVKQHLANKRQGTHKSKSVEKLLEVPAKLKSKKVQELRVQEASKTHSSVEEVVFLVRNPATIPKK